MQQVPPISASGIAGARATAARLNAAWIKNSFAYNKALIRALADAIDTHRLEFAMLESLDVGKPIKHTWTDDIPTTVGVLCRHASPMVHLHEIGS